MKFKRKFNLTTADGDRYDRIRPFSILEHFQEVAGMHAEELGIGYSKFSERNLYWVILRFKYDIVAPIDIHDRTIEVITYPTLKGRVDFNREYEIRNSNGTLLVTGVSKWCVIDAKTRRIMRTNNIEYNYELDNNLIYPDDVDKITPLMKDELTFSHKEVVLSSKIDHNGHLNNARYADFILDVLALNQDEEIISFKINFVKEAILNDEIMLYYKKIAYNIYYICGYINDNILNFTSIVKTEKR